MNNYVISCCSPVDYAKEDLAVLDVEFVYFHIILDGKDYLDDFGKSLSAETLLDAQRAGRDVKTSQISVGEYKDFFLSSKKGVTFCISRFPVAFPAPLTLPIWQPII